jgi:hypothetical protein
LSNGATQEKNNEESNRNNRVLWNEQLKGDNKSNDSFYPFVPQGKDCHGKIIRDVLAGNNG